MHLRSVHSHHFNVADDTEQPLPPDVVWAYHEKLTSFSSLFALAVIKSHPTGKICNANGMDLPEGTPPLPHTPQGQDDWAPYWIQLKFETTKHLFSNAQTSAGKIDNLLYLWGLSLAVHQDEPPFADHKDLYEMIDSTSIGNVPWKSFGVRYEGSCPL